MHKQIRKLNEKKYEQHLDTFLSIIEVNYLKPLEFIGIILIKVLIRKIKKIVVNALPGRNTASVFDRIWRANNKYSNSKVVNTKTDFSVPDRNI